MGYISCDDSAKSTVELFGEAERKMYKAKEKIKKPDKKVRNKKGGMK